MLLTLIFTAFYPLLFLFFGRVNLGLRYYIILLLYQQEETATETGEGVAVFRVFLYEHL